MTSAALSLDISSLKPGLRLAIGLSGGADSVALTCTLAAAAPKLGVIISAAHLHHGLRGEEADADRQFCADLAKALNLPFLTHQVDTAAQAAPQPEFGKSKETIEEAARRLRYAWFSQLMAGGEVEAVATAHTLDDQAETVLGKFLRGAWTEGLSGIHPIVEFPAGRILRPLLAVSRSQVEAYLAGIHQPWREDSSNLDPAFTRNRLRHQLLPQLEQWNPNIRQHLANMASLARDEESWWQTEIARLAPQFLLSGRPVRGGGRAASHNGELALDTVRLAAQPPALQRRLLRHAAQILGTSLAFDATESLRNLAVQGRSGQSINLPGPILAERTPRELRLSQGLAAQRTQAPEIQLLIPGRVSAFGWRFDADAPNPSPSATVRNWRPGDRVTLRYSSGPRKIKDVLERMKVTGSDRAVWPVVEWQGEIVWMQGAEVVPHAKLNLNAVREE